MAIIKYPFRNPTYAPWRELDEVSNRLARLFDDASPPASRMSTMPAGEVPRHQDLFPERVERPLREVGEIERGRPARRIPERTAAPVRTVPDTPAGARAA
jgi:hypothetical protein